MRTVPTLLALCSLLGLARAADSSCFHANASRDGVYSTSTLSAPKGLKWSHATGGPVVSSPTVHAGRIYVGSDDGKFYCLDLATGSEKWSFTTGSLVRSSAAVSEGSVWFASFDGNVYCLDADSGALRWKFATAGERKFSARGIHSYLPKTQDIPDFWDLWQSSPIVAEGLVHIGSGDGNVYALDARTGEKKWAFATGGVVHSSPALAGGLLYIGSFDRKLYALDARTGALRWSFTTGEDAENHNQEGIQASPTVVGGVVYFGARDFHMYALDAATGAEKWRHKITWSNATAAVANGRVYYGTSIPAHFVALDAATGKEAYKVDLKIPVFSSPALAGGTGFVGSFSGRLYAIDLAEGRVVWDFQTEASRANRAVVLAPDGTFDFKRIFTSRFYEDMQRSGDKLFDLGAFISSPAISSGILVIGSTDGNIYAFE